MKRVPPFLLPIVFAFVPGAAPMPPAALVEQADRSLLAEDFTRAIALYEKAEPRAADPSHVTFHLATAKYLRSLKDNSSNDLDEAEQLYRCLLGSHEPRRAKALFGVGNCQLQRAGDRDSDAVLTAIEAYEQCLEAAKNDEKLTADARHNLERARLLLYQIRREESKPPPDKDPEGGEDPKPKKPNEPEMKPDRDEPKKPGNDKTKPAGPPEPIKDKNGKPIEIDEPPPPGAGKLPQVPDEADLPPLSAKDALEHLKQANQRIWKERHQHRLGIAKPPASDVRDW